MTVDLISRCISTARPTARMVWKTMLSTTYSVVTTSAFQNSLSLGDLDEVVEADEARRTQQVVAGEAK